MAISQIWFIQSTVVDQIHSTEAGCSFADRCKTKRKYLGIIPGLLLECQSPNLSLTVLHVPCPLDCGHQPGTGCEAHARARNLVFARQRQWGRGAKEVASTPSPKPKALNLKLQAPEP